MRYTKGRKPTPYTNPVTDTSMDISLNVFFLINYVKVCMFVFIFTLS